MDIVNLEPEQIPVAGRIMARAMFPDPLAAHMYPDPEERQALLPWHFRAVVRYGVLFGRVLTTSGGPTGVAIWFPPEQTSMTEERVEAAGLDAAPAVLGEEAFGRFIAVTDELEQFHQEDAAGRHWYLALLGVDPDHSGQGIGSALIRPVLAEADRDALPCYLETAEQRNVGFYEQFGFDVLRHGVATGSDVEYWTMLRPPAQS
jgi:GNAT superfamily N-acetyltransferase